MIHHGDTEDTEKFILFSLCSLCLRGEIGYSKSVNITVFTSNQPRHIALIEALADIADRVYAIQECNTIAPGQVEDFFRKSPVMQDYFSRVIAAEDTVFGRPRLLPANVRSMAIRMGDLARLSLDD